MVIKDIQKCIKCGKKFKDSYDQLNELNKRVWCNSCVKKEWDIKLNHRRIIKNG